MHRYAETLEIVSSTFFFIPYFGNNDNPCYNDTLRKDRELSLLSSSTVFFLYLWCALFFPPAVRAKYIFGLTLHTCVSRTFVITFDACLIKPTPLKQRNAPPSDKPKTG